MRCLLNALSVSLLSFIIGGVTACRPGWQEYRGYCYLYKPEKSTFFEAKGVTVKNCVQVTCDLFGSYLAIIRSDEENTFLVNLIKSNADNVAWIGLEDLETEGKFVWYPTEEAATYTSWLPSDPNDYNHMEDCVTTRNDGQWQDWYCESKHPAICQMENGEEVIG